MGKIFVSVVMLTPFACWAHVTHDQPSLLSGIVHPFTGVDHMLALLAVGWMAWQQKSHSSMIAIPASFLGGLLLGAFLGILGHAPQAVEYGIATSLLIFGVMMARVSNAKYIWPFALIAGLFHGFAHGAEMPVNSSMAMYFSGFLVSSALLVYLGTQGHCRLAASRVMRKAASATMIVAGVLFLFGNA